MNGCNVGVHRRALRILTSAALLIAGAAAAGQERADPTLETSTNVVRIDVSVLGRNGQPVPDLTPADFVVSIDGRGRRVVAADYIAATAGDPPPESAHYSTNAGAARGRLIVMIVDHGTIQAGRAQHALIAADGFIARLHPSDRVALVTVPGTADIHFTSNREVIRSQLKRVLGAASTFTSFRQVGVTEALAIARGDPRAIELAFARECAGVARIEQRTCRSALVAHASMLYAETRDTSRNTVATIRTLLERLSQTREQKTLILVSGGLILDQEQWQLSWYGSLAARAQVAVYSLYIPGPHFDAALQRLSPQYREDMTLAEEGLEYVARYGRGSLFRVANDPEAVFRRVALEISAYYLLGIETDAADRDNRLHKLKVEVPARRDIEVRARPEFSSLPPETGTLEETLADTLNAPLVVGDIRLRATTYTLRDHDGRQLRVVIGAELERMRETAGRMALAFAVFDSQGRLVARHVESEVGTQRNPRTGAHQYFAAVRVPHPGVYTLKLAVVDDLRRRGSVERTFNAQLTPVGQLHAGDLLLAETATDSAAEAEPIVSAEYTSDVLHTLVELYSQPGDELSDATVTFDVADTAGGRPLSTAPATPAQRGDRSPDVRILRAALPIAVLPPGEYVARATISKAGREIGRITRPFRVARAVVTAGGGRGIRPPAIIASQAGAFDRHTVLAGNVVGFFLERLTARQVTVSERALMHVRAGDYDALLTELKDAHNDELAAAFLSGIALYARGELDPAAGRFRDALRADSEFFPAAFYLGACYAAGGRHLEAANAWQTSLVTESDAPFIYPLIADARLRARDPAGAVNILMEAVARWPEDQDLHVRLGVAYASAGRHADAVRVLEPHLERHPEDHERLFVVLRALYDARNAGTSVATPERDRALFARLAAAYAKAGGPHQPLVERWRSFIEGK